MARGGIFISALPVRMAMGRRKVATSSAKTEKQLHKVHKSGKATVSGDSHPQLGSNDRNQECFTVNRMVPLACRSSAAFPAMLQ